MFTPSGLRLKTYFSMPLAQLREPMWLWAASMSETCEQRTSAGGSKAIGAEGTYVFALKGERGGKAGRRHAGQSCCSGG